MEKTYSYLKNDKKVEFVCEYTSELETREDYENGFELTEVVESQKITLYVDGEIIGHANHVSEVSMNSMSAEKYDFAVKNGATHFVVLSKGLKETMVFLNEENALALIEVLNSFKEFNTAEIKEFNAEEERKENIQEIKVLEETIGRAIITENKEADIKSYDALHNEGKEGYRPIFVTQSEYDIVITRLANLKGGLLMDKWICKECGCITTLQDFDHDLKQLVATKGGKSHTITPADIDDMEACIHNLNNGSCPRCDRWEDGMGNAVCI